MNNHNITPQVIRNWDVSRLTKLSQDIRDRIIEVVGKRGGHLAPSLGVVELTIALHYVFDTPKDKIVWDVGHQSYAHKLITGRWREFDTLRTYQGIAGFPKRNESEYDTFNTGHSGNSISVALGITSAAKLKGENIKSIAVIGDGSIVTGMAFEALNYAGTSHQNLIVILNDNEMSIGKSTGAMAKYFSRMITGRMYNRLKSDAWKLLGILPKNMSGRARFAARKVEEGLKNLIAPSIIFEELGFRYIGPFDGHDLQLLIETFKRVKNMKGPVLVHVVTKKGKGYAPAEKDPEVFHGIGPFLEKTSNNVDKKLLSGSDVFGKALMDLAENDTRICAISAGMCLGTGLAEFKRKIPERFFDVGICEQHAVTFAAGLALKGLRPVVAIYSTFLTRAYDQIVQDVALQNLPVVFAIDRAGIVGEDGPTHHGNFDVSFLRSIPNMTIAAPKDLNELVNVLNFGLNYDGPFVIRYPRGNLKQCNWQQYNNKIEIGKAEIVYEIQTKNKKNKLIILAIGSMVANSYEAINTIIEEETNIIKSINITLINMRFIKPLDEAVLLNTIQSGDTVITVEENAIAGGFGSAIIELLNARYNESSNNNKQVSIIRIGLDDSFIEQGKREQLLDQHGLSVKKLREKFIRVIEDASSKK